VSKKRCSGRVAQREKPVWLVLKRAHVLRVPYESQRITENEGADKTEIDDYSTGKTGIESYRSSKEEAERIDAFLRESEGKRPRDELVKGNCLKIGLSGGSTSVKDEHKNSAKWGPERS